MNREGVNKSESGFTLVEVIMASLILVIGLSIFGTLMVNITHKNFFSNRHTQAVILAQNKIEELLTEGYESEDMEEGSYENALNPVDATADSGGVFYQFWTIYDLRPIPRSKQIVSEVQWLDEKGVTQSVILTATCIDESN